MFQQGWGPNAFVQNNFEWRDAASLTRGSHSLKVGGNVTRGHADHESSRVFDRPDFSFNSIFDFATDVATSETGIGFNPVSGAVGNPLFSLMRTGSLSAFIQDDWKVKPNFTLSMGFRYEDFFNPSDAYGKVCEMAFPVKGSLPTQIANGAMTCRKNMFNGTMNTWSPRIGFAWDPTKEGKMSIRGGIGIFYDRPSDQLDNNYYTNTPQFAVGGAFSNTPNNLPLFALGTTPVPPYNYPLPPAWCRPYCQTLPHRADCSLDRPVCRSSIRICRCRTCRTGSLGCNAHLASHGLLKSTTLVQWVGISMPLITSTGSTET